VGQQLFGLDLLGEMPAAGALLERLATNPHVSGIAAKRDAAMPAFIASARERYRSAG
jgi:glutathione S-transferase